MTPSGTEAGVLGATPSPPSAAQTESGEVVAGGSRDPARIDAGAAGPDGPARRRRSRRRRGKRSRGGSGGGETTATVAAPEPVEGPKSQATRAPAATPDGGAPAPKRRRRSRRRKPRSAAAAPDATASPPELQAVRSADGSDDVSTLGGSMRAVVLRHTSDPVLARARGYVRQRRVSGLRVRGGVVRARVRGSSRQQYRVELSAPGPPVPMLVKKLRWSCNCPYAAEHRRTTCKHVVAVALVASERLERSEELAAQWLGHVGDESLAASPAAFDALADRLLATFSAPPASAVDALRRADAIAAAPFEVEHSA
jgi:hypothetical protein